jgi:hypothetical protein
MVAIKMPVDKVTLLWNTIVPLFNKDTAPLGSVKLSRFILNRGFPEEKV